MCAACPEEGRWKEGMTVSSWHTGFPFLRGAAGSRGRSAFEFQLSDARVRRSQRIVRGFELSMLAGARVTLSRSRCYGYVLSLPRAILISHRYSRGVTGSCKVRTSR